MRRADLSARLSSSVRRKKKSLVVEMTIESAPHLMRHLFVSPLSYMEKIW